METGTALCVLFACCFAVVSTQPQTANNCPENHGGANCTECHCLNGASVCDLDLGICTDYQCDRGWTDTPHCQTPCSADTWGINCARECHCRSGDACDRINGVCNGSCDAEWSGASCQIRLTRLTQPPAVTNITCDEFVISWRAWSPDLDTGNPPVGSYSVEKSINSSSWDLYTTITASDPDQSLFTVRFSGVNHYSYYSFRILANRIEYGKVVAGLAGPSSQPLRPLEVCIEPTTETFDTEAMSTEGVTTVVTTTTQVVTTDDILTTEVTTLPTTLPTTEELTTVAQNPPGPVRQLSMQVDDLTGNLLLSWSAPPNLIVPLVSYNLTYQVIGIGDCNDTFNEQPISEELNARRGSFEVTNLTPWRKYLVTLVAVNIAGPGSVSQETIFSADTTPTGAVKGVVASSVSSRSATFEWAEVPCSERGGVIVYYQVLVWKQEGNNQITEANRDIRTGHSYTISSLSPYAQYGVRVRYVNSVGAGPYSDDLYITTAQDVPAAPTRLIISEKTDTSLFLSWDPPSPSNGLIEQYRIIFTSARDPQVENSVVQDAMNSGNYKNITNLEPYTEYKIQIQARTQALTNDGWGIKSASVSVVTADGLPGQPKNLALDSRSESCISLEWDAPDDINGVLTGYKLTYYSVVIQSSYSSTPEVMRTLTPNSLAYEACSLIPAAQYRFLLSAGTSKGFGEEAFVNVWTEVGLPENPPRPEVASVGDNTISIRIQPVVLTTGPVSGYFIIVEAIEAKKRRKKRTLPDPVTAIGLPGYTTAELTRSDVRVARDFTVGDQRIYGGYTNSRLQRAQIYNIYYVVASSLDGVTKMSFSQLVSPVETGEVYSTLPTLPSTVVPTTTPTTVPPTAEEVESDNATLIVVASVVSVIVLIILIILIIIIIWCYKRRKSQKLPTKDPKNESWLQYYTNHFYNSPLKDKTKWSDTVDLNESRHPTINDKYTPNDLKVSELHHNRPRISFEEEYKRLPSKLAFPYSEAQKPANLERNRFDHILPYDHSRVVLRDTANSYINASYIDSFDLHHAYIAAQSPFNEVTMCDFWYMVYQEKASHIIFLARLVEDGTVKSEMYWPEKGSQLHGVITVQHLNTEVYANFIVRTFNVDLEGSGPRRVTQYQFTSWPDHGIPEDPIPFLEFIYKVKRSRTSNKHPLVVHCGTGVSRSAVYIAVDSLLEQAKIEHAVNVYRFCNKMRRNRTMMVRTVKQYIFIYDILFEALITNHNVVGRDLKTSYRILSDTNPTSDKSYFREQFEVLERYIPEPNSSHYRTATRSDNTQKNRFNTLRLLAPDKHRTPIQNAAALGSTDYINAFFVDSYLTRNTFIVTQTPLERTVIDFWRLVYEYNVKTIVMVNGPDFKEDTCAQYWPERVGLQKWQQFFVNLVSEKDSEYMTVRHLELASDVQPTKPARTVMQFQFKAWKMYDKVPWSREAMMTYVERVEKWQKSGATQGPLVVHCMDGAGQSGLFLACYIMGEKMRAEGHVDLFHTVKHLKMRRFHMINCLEQYKFCFKFLWDFMHTRLTTGQTGMANGRINHAYEEDVFP